MKLLVTGSQGQVARSLAALANERDVIVSHLARPNLDLSATKALKQTVRQAIDAAKPDVLVSAAAYTAVDKAEDEPELAHAINATAPGILASVANEADIPIIHLSTDYVFDGTLDRPYCETDTPSPTGVYGASKLAGEQAVAQANRSHVIARTAWVYSAYGSNFLKTMQRLADERDELRVVGDQWGNPTSAHDIADAIISIANQLNGKSDITDPHLFGTFHMAGTDDTTWAGFAHHIMKVCCKLGREHAKVKAIATAEYPTIAKRPMNSRLDCKKLSEVFGVTLPSWKFSTQQVSDLLWSTNQ